MMDVTNIKIEPKAPDSVSVDQLNIEILPAVYDLIRSLNKDSHDVNFKVQDCAQKVLQLRDKLEHAKVQIEGLPGIQYSLEENKSILNSLRQQLILKRELIEKYRNMCDFGTTKP